MVKPILAKAGITFHPTKNPPSKKPRGFKSLVSDQTRETFPALMQDVQTFRRFGELLTTACTVWMFGLKRRLVRRCEWEMAWPKPGPLPQTSHTAAIVTP